MRVSDAHAPAHRFRQREAEPVCCGAVEGASHAKPGPTFAFANQIVVVRVSVSI